MVKPDFYKIKDVNETSVILPKASEEFGPISHYYLVVVPDEEAVKTPDQFSLEEVKSDDVVLSSNSIIFTASVIIGGGGGRGKGVYPFLRTLHRINDSPQERGRNSSPPLPPKFLARSYIVDALLPFLLNVAKKLYKKL